MVDASRSMTEWLAARLDIDIATARQLMLLARADEPEIDSDLRHGRVSIDRAVAVTRLKATGAESGVVNRSFGLDITGLRRLTSGRARISSESEREVHSRRLLHVQPALDESSYRLWGELPGVDGRVVEKALQAQVDEFSGHPAVSAARARRMPSHRSARTG